VDFADLVRNPGVEENPLRRGRLPGIDVGHDADIAGSIERCLARHYVNSSIYESTNLRIEGFELGIESRNPNS
jgi:hypothetical protein